MSINLDFLDKKFQDLVAKGNFLQITKATQNLEAQSTFRLGTNSVRALTRVSSGEDILVFKNDSDGLLYAIAGRREESQVINQRTILSRHTKPSKKIRGQKEGQVAVLYSVVAGEVREFWVKTAKFDVKVHEISTQKTATPFFSWGDAIGQSTTASGSFTTANDIAYFGDDYVICPPGTAAGLIVETTAQWLSGVGRRAVVQSSLTNDGNSIVLSFFPTNTGSGSTVVSGPGAGGGDLAKGRRFIVRAEFFLDSGTATVSWSGSVTHTISSIFGGWLVPVAYEAWISATPTNIYVIIKYLQGFLVVDDAEDFDSLQLITLNRAGDILSSAAYVVGDTVPVNTSNWRDSFSNFLAVANQSASGDSCVDTHRTNTSANLFDGNLYTVSGGSLSTQSATSEETCNLGSATTSMVKVPSPDRGTVEGISYTPPKRR